jgi:hypothetical protein
MDQFKKTLYDLNINLNIKIHNRNYIHANIDKSCYDIGIIYKGLGKYMKAL